MCLGKIKLCAGEGMGEQEQRRDSHDAALASARVFPTTLFTLLTIICVLTCLSPLITHEFPRGRKHVKETFGTTQLPGTKEEFNECWAQEYFISGFTVYQVLSYPIRHFTFKMTLSGGHS